MTNYRYFLAIAECRNLTEAANKLFITQPSLSKFLKQLEFSLGVELFDRKKRPMELTQAGEIYYKYVIEMMEKHKNLLLNLHAVQESGSKNIKIGIGPWRGSCILPFVVPRYQKYFPDVKLSFLEGTSEIMSRALYKDELDLCIMGLEDAPSFSDHEILYREKIYLAGNKNHPLVVRLAEENRPQTTGGCFPSVNLRDFSNEQFLMTPEANLFTRIIQRYFSSVHFQPRSIIRIPNLATELHMVEHMSEDDSYFAFIPEIGVRTLSTASNVKFFAIENTELIYTIAAVYRKNTPLSHLGRYFIDCVRDFYEEFRK